MSDLAARALTGLETHASPRRIGHASGPAGVSMMLRTPPALASVIARRGARAASYEVARKEFAIEPPDTPRLAAAGSLTLIWTGPDQWLAMSEGEDGSRLETRLRSGFAGLASVADQSDGRTIIRIAGACARDTLAKGLPIDLTPESFSPGQTALSLIGHIGIQIWQVDDGPTYDIAVFRSYAADLWRFLCHAGAEFGIQIA